MKSHIKQIFFTIMILFVSGIALLVIYSRNYVPDAVPPTFSSNIETVLSSYERQSFKERAYVRNEVYSGSFTELYYEFSSISVDIGVQDKVFNNESRAETLIESVLSDVRQARERISNGVFTTIHIVDISAYRFPVAVGAELFCTADDVENKTYRTELIKAMYGVNEYWSKIGCTLLVFDDPLEFDENRLSVWYDEHGIEILDLFGARFLDDWNTPIEIEIAKATAKSLTGFILSNYSMDVLYGYLPDDVKTHWLWAIGLDTVYCNPDDIYLTEMTFRTGRTYLLEVEYDNYKYNIDKIDALYEEYDLISAGDLRDFFISERRGKQLIINYFYDSLGEEASSYIEAIKQQQITYYIEMSELSHMNASTTRYDIYINVPLFALHEWSHQLLAPTSFRSASGFTEGLCDYLGYIVADNHYYKNYIYNAFDLPENDIYRSLYLGMGGTLDSVDVFDMRIYIDLQVLNQLNDPSLIEGRMIGQVYMLPQPYSWGYELSYAQAHSLIQYITAEYSFADALSLLTISDSEYVRVFGKPYEELKADWVAWLQQRYDYYYKWQE